MNKENAAHDLQSDCDHTEIGGQHPRRVMHACIKFERLLTLKKQLLSERPEDWQQALVRISKMFRVRYESLLATEQAMVETWARNHSPEMHDAVSPTE